MNGHQMQETHFKKSNLQKSPQILYMNRVYELDV